MFLRVGAIAVTAAFLCSFTALSAEPDTAFAVSVQVSPKWRETLQHPTYPPPTSYRVTALITIAGTKKLLAAPEVEISAGESKSVENVANGIAISLSAKLDSKPERAVVVVRGLRESRIIFENQTDVWLEPPPPLKP